MNRYFCTEDMQMGNKNMKRCLTPSVIRECKSKPQRNATSHSLGQLQSHTQTQQGSEIKQRNPTLAHCL
jgi:hypothetical protein